MINFNYAILAFSLMSITTSIFIFFIFFVYKEVRIPSYRLIIYLQFGNFLEALSRLFAMINILYLPQDIWCEISINFLGIGNMQSLLWTLMYSI
jgi:hypothetical protein